MISAGGGGSLVCAVCVVAAVGSGLDLACPAVSQTYPLPRVLCLQETESEAEDNLDDLERHLREKALRSMRKAQVSPQS